MQNTIDSTTGSGIIGKLKCFNFERGYGFVCRDDTKEDVFIHQSAIDKCDKYHHQKLIKLGEEITFDIVDGDKSNEAANIYSIDEVQIMLCAQSISESGNLSIEDRIISSENISCTDNDNESLQSFLRSDIIQSYDEELAAYMYGEEKLNDTANINFNDSDELIQLSSCKEDSNIDDVTELFQSFFKN